MKYINSLFVIIRYRHRLKKRIEEAFPSQLFFVSVKTNTPEVIISKNCIENTVQSSMDKMALLEEAALFMRNDIKEHYENLSEISWPPNLNELDEQTMSQYSNVSNQTPGL